MKIQNTLNSAGARAAAYSAPAPASAPRLAPNDALQAPGTEEVKTLVAQINKTLQSLSHNLEFSVDEGSKMNVVKVVDPATKDIIRQFPSREVLVIAEALNNFTGLLLKERA